MDEGLKKAVVMLASIPEAQSAALIHALSPDEFERLALAAAHVDAVSVDEQQQLAVEFVDRQVRKGPRVVSCDAGNSAAGTLDRFEFPLAVDDPDLQRDLADLQAAPAAWLATQLSLELPQTAAVAICHLGPVQAAAVLAHLTTEAQLSIVRRIAFAGGADRSAIQCLIQMLSRRFRCQRLEQSAPSGGLPFVAQIVNRLDRSTERALLENLAQEDRSLVDQLLRVMFVLKDRSRVSHQSRPAA